MHVVPPRVPLDRRLPLRWRDSEHRAVPPGVSGPQLGVHIGPRGFGGALRQGDLLLKCSTLRKIISNSKSVCRQRKLYYVYLLGRLLHEFSESSLRDAIRA